MKAFYLVPRKIVDNRKAAHSPAYPTVKAAARHLTVKPPPPPQLHTNPSIKHLIDLKLKVRDHEYARSLLNHYDATGIVRWDLNGNVLAPVSGIHIINDIIHKMTVLKSVFLPDKLPIAQLFFTLTSTSRDLLCNTTASSQVYEPPSVKRKATVKIDPHSKRNASWIVY